jgi:hypothetical protein
MVMAHVLVDDEVVPAAAQARTTAAASAWLPASGFCARIPRMCCRIAAARMIPGWTSGGTATSMTAIRGSSSSASTVAWTRGMPWRVATASAASRRRAAIAATVNPAAR